MEAKPPKEEPGAAAARALPPPPRFWRVIRRGMRAAWDSLGLVCAMSFTLFVGAAVPVWTAYGVVRLAPNIGLSVAAAVGVVLALLIVPPLVAGALFVTQQSLAHRIVAAEEPAYWDLWRASRRLYGRAVILGASQFALTAALAANIALYLTRAGFVSFLLAALFGYLLVFWLLNLLYQWPLLAAADAGLIPREAGRGVRLSAVFRNAFIMASSAPGFTSALLLAILLPAVPLIASGIGMALLLPGYAAFLTTQATRDQLVRFAILAPEPDPDAPAEDPGFRV